MKSVDDLEKYNNEPNLVVSVRGLPTPRPPFLHDEIPGNIAVMVRKESGKKYCAEN